MPRLALALYIVWYLTLFGVRSVIHWKRTGSTGVKGFRGSPGSIAWWAGVSLSVGFLVTFLAPIAAVREWPTGALLFESAALHWLGAALVVVGNAGCFLAQNGMGDSWRVGVDETETTTLVTTGFFAWVRNPIFTFMGVSLIGLLFLVPNAAALLGGLLCIVGIEAQVRNVEEPYLADTHGDDYGEYTARVGRFFPRIGCWESPAGKSEIGQTG